MDGVGGTVKNVVFRKVKSGFLTIYTPFQFYQAVTEYVSSIKCVYLSEEDVLEEPDNMDQESKPIGKTLRIHKVERCEVKGVYGLKFSYLAEDNKPFFTRWYAIGKDVVVCGHEDSKADTMLV